MVRESKYHLRVMHEGVAGARVGGQLAGAGQLQALDDSLQRQENRASKNQSGKHPISWVHRRGLIGSGESNTYRLAGAVGADDKGERLEEGDDVLVVRVEAPDALDEHLVHRAHLAPRPSGSSSPASGSPPPVGAGAIARNLGCGCYSGIHLLIWLRHG